MGKPLLAIFPPAPLTSRRNYGNYNGLRRFHVGSEWNAEDEARSHVPFIRDLPSRTLISVSLVEKDFVDSGMRYTIRQKAISLGDDFSIYDEAGKEAFFVDGHAFSFGQKLVVYDPRRREVARIRQKLFGLRKSFAVWESGLLKATVRKAALAFRPKFVIDIPGPRDYAVVGDFIAHEYRFTRDRREVAVVSKHQFATSDSYTVEIKGGDIMLILCTAIIIDLVLHN